MTQKAFITGGTGFVGSHLAQLLLAHGFDEVRCLIRTRPKWLTGIDIVPVRGMLNDRSLVEDAVCDANYVYHLGGVTRARTYEELEAGNVTATTQLLDAVIAANPGVTKVLITSSLAAVGRVPDGCADESSPLRPISRYGRSKAAMEVAIRDYYPKLPMVVVRPPSVYGPRDRDVFTFFKAVQQGVCPILRGDAGLTLVHVSDLVRGMVAAAESDAATGGTYFIGSDEDISWEKLKQATMNVLGAHAITIPVPRSMVIPVATIVEHVSRVFGRYPPFNREKARELLHTAKKCSSAKARGDFGYEARLSLEQGLQGTIVWYREQGWLH